MADQHDLVADVWLIYQSDQDSGMWVAHSLKTDQIAMGDSVLHAYVVMKRVMRAFWEARAADPDIQIEPAPKAILDKLKDAKPLENSLLDRADELLGRRTIRTPSGTVFKALDLESRALVAAPAE